MEITIRGEPEEFEEEFGISISSIRSADENVETLLTDEEQLILQTVRDNPGHALRTVQKRVAKIDESPWDYSGEWDSDRTKIRHILRTLKSRDLIRLDDRSYYPADHEIVSN